MSLERNAYDHRLRELPCRTRHLDLAERLGVPRSTAKSRLRRGARPVATTDVLDKDVEKLRAWFAIGRFIRDRLSCSKVDLQDSCLGAIEQE
jgi:hypothetical protein